ncbi:MAG: diguanylate cyclase [Lachnospiraceae bacterium]
MQDKGKKMLQMLVLCILAACLFLGGKKSESLEEQQKMQEEQTSKTTDSGDIVTYLLETDSFAYEDQIMQKWNQKNKKHQIEKLYPDEKEKVAFIKGSLLAYNGEYIEAKKELKKATELCENTKSHHRFLARIYYELSKISIYQNEFIVSDQFAKKMEKVYEGVEDKQYLIQLEMWRSFDVADTPNGGEKSVKIMKKTYKMAQKSEYPNMEKVLFQMALAYSYADDTVREMRYKIQALSVAESKNSSETVKIATDIGLDFMYHQNYDKALDYLKEAYAFQEKDSKKDAQQKLYICQNMAATYIAKGEYESARKSIDEAEKAADREPVGKGQEDDKTNLLTVRALYDVYTGQAKRALTLLDEAKERYEKSSCFAYDGFDVTLDSLYGCAYYKLGDYEKALKSFKKMDEKTKRMDAGIRAGYLQDMYKVYRDMGESRLAYQYADELYELRTEAYRVQATGNAQGLVEEFESTQKQEKIATLEKKNRQMYHLATAMGVVIIVFSVCGILIWRKNAEIAHLNRKFKDMSEKDGLTGLNNRRALDLYLEQKYGSISGKKTPVSVAMMDVDFFKKYNDNYGHQAGDLVLKEVADALKKNTRTTDFSARYGGEEFIVIMPDTSKEEAIQVMQQIRLDIKKRAIPHAYSPVCAVVSVSIGVTTTEAEQKVRSQTLIHEADAALYQAKKTRDTVCVFCTEMENSLAEEL